MHTQYNVERIKDAADLESVIRDFMSLQKAGKDLKGKCPLCGSGSFTVAPAKKMFKCFGCSEGGKDAIAYLMKMERKTYPEALEYLSTKYSIEPIDDKKQKKYLEAEAKKRKNGKKKQKSFRDAQLASSGLLMEDVMANITIDDKKVERNPYRKGTLNQYYRLIPEEGDDMIIYYYTLEGKEDLFKPEKSNKYEPFYRVRFQNPEERKDKFGKPIKYYSPKGSGSHLYVPEKIRQMYTNGRKIKRLFLQEGEKKAEKACKHGIHSVGIMGIHNVGSKNIMPKDLQLLIQKCEVEEVVFLLDADWQDLSGNIRVGDNVQKRPLTFFYAVKNFKEYMLTFRNLDINLEVYFGAPKPSCQEKGVDDILAGPFKGKEEDFVKDIETAINTKDGHGEYLQIHKITALTDYQIKDFWKLNNYSDFAKLHKEVLQHIPEFTINKTKYRINDDGVLELAEPIQNEERYWATDQKGKVSFNYKRCYTFLRNRGFGRIRMQGAKPYVQFQNHVIKTVERGDVKDFVMDVTEQIAPEDVQNLLYQGGHFYLGDHSLENLKYFDIDFERPRKDSQNMHFANKFWKVTSEGITEHLPNERRQTIWNDKIIPFDATQTEPLVLFHEINEAFIESRPTADREALKEYQGKYWMEITQSGEEAHFLQFLKNASNFYWRDKNKKKDRKEEIEEYMDISMHLLSKLTAFGYMCHRFHNASTAKAVICMDGKLSEVGASNGRSGKSIFGLALSKILPQAYIGGKRRNLTEDQFLFEEVNEKIENVFFDDIRANMDFEFFFPNITGRWMINRKGVGRITLPPETSPKLLFTTNHAVNGDGASFRDRQHYIVFSDYYNDNHKPTDDFGVLFFDEWDQKQWNLFYNMTATCLQLYFQHSLVEAPSSDIELRRLRQQMGEDFLTWAEEYFSPAVDDHRLDKNNLNTRLARNDLYNDFIQKHTRAARHMTPTRFGKCVKWFCKYKNYHFNAHKPHKELGITFDDFLEGGGRIFVGEADKSAGVEYFTLSQGATHNDNDIPFN